MTADYGQVLDGQALDRMLAEIAASTAVPPPQVGQARSYHNPGVDIARLLARTRTEERLRCEAGLPAAEETLAAVDAAVEGRCAGPGCSAILTERSASAHFCGPTCQEVWQQRQAGRPSPGSAPVRGSEEVDPSAMRWRPDLVTAFDDSGLTLLDRHHRDDTGLDYCIYNRSDARLAHLRVDDGYRFVGMDVPWAELEASGPSEPFRRLERELTDQRRLGPTPFADAFERHIAPHLAMYHRHRAAVEAWEAENTVRVTTGHHLLVNDEARERVCGWLRANDIDPETVPGDADIRVSEDRIYYEVFRPRGPGPLRERAQAPLVQPWPAPELPQPATGGVFWLPNPPADPEAPTPAELAGGIELGTAPAPATAGQRIRQIGEQLAGVMGRTVTAYQAFPAALRGAVEAERDRQTLRAVCADEAMYERALAEVRSSVRSVRQMAEAVAAGRYTEEGWADLDRTAQAVGATWEEVLAACRALEGHNPAVRFDACTAVVEALRSQAPRSRAPDLPVGGLFDIPIRIDDRLPPEAWRLEYADGQRFESHVCRWELGARQDPSDWRPRRHVPAEWFWCSLLWSDDVRCDQRTVDPGEVRRTERLVSGISATGGPS